MLFKDILDKKSHDLAYEFDQLFELILKNQTHDCDLLLTHINGFYNPESLTCDNIKNLNPYMFGLSIEGISAVTHYEFIREYRDIALSQIPYQDYLKEIKGSEERRVDIEEKVKSERLTIQLEMLVYLKIWESSTFIKKFWQLSALLTGKAYNWHLKKVNDTKKTVREIADCFENTSQKLYEAFNLAYNEQIRNSIAHSNYSIINRNISLNNQDKRNPAHVYGLSFDKWIDIFHTTMILYDQQIRFFNKVNSFYGQCALYHENMLQVRITKNNLEEEFRYLLYRPIFNSWTWWTSDTAED